VKMKAKIVERGNGLPDVGDYVSADDGEVYSVLAFEGPIHTGSPGEGNYIYAQVELADWSDVTDDSEPTCTCELESE
jgi:hypothetical protein